MVHNPIFPSFGGTLGPKFRSFRGTPETIELEQLRSPEFLNRQIELQRERKRFSENLSKALQTQSDFGENTEPLGFVGGAGSLSHLRIKGSSLIPFNLLNPANRGVLEMLKPVLENMGGRPILVGSEVPEAELQSLQNIFGPRIPFKRVPAFSDEIREILGLPVIRNIFTGLSSKGREKKQKTSFGKGLGKGVQGQSFNNVINTMLSEILGE